MKKETAIVYLIIFLLGSAVGSGVCLAADNPDATAKLKAIINRELSAKQEGEIKALLDQGADINAMAAPPLISYSKYTLLGTASYYGRPEIVRLLLDRGAEVDKGGSDNGVTPLYAAVLKGHPEIVKMLLDKGAQVDKPRNNGETPLYTASDKGHLEIVKLLLEKGAQVNKANNDDFTPLFNAVHTKAELVKLLLDKGAEVDRVTKGGSRPLMFAVLFGHTDVASLLLERGAQPDKADEDGWTPLHLSSRMGKLEMVRLLLDKGAQVNKYNNEGTTTLYIASEEGHMEIVKLLIERGADVNKAKNTRATPLFVAKTKGHQQIAELLMQHGAKELPTGDLQAVRRAEFRERQRLIVNEYFVNLHEGMSIDETREWIGPFFEHPMSDSFFNDTVDGNLLLENDLYVLIYKDNKLKCWKRQGSKYVWPDWSPEKNFSPCARLYDQLKTKRQVVFFFSIL
jgi:ankyrin repeat protein